MNTSKALTKEEISTLVNKLARGRFTMVRKIRINEQFLQKLTKSGAITDGGTQSIPSFGSVPVQIDNSIETYEFDY